LQRLGTHCKVVETCAGRGSGPAEKLADATPRLSPAECCPVPFTIRAGLNFTAALPCSPPNRSAMRPDAVLTHAPAAAGCMRGHADMTEVCRPLIALALPPPS
jgi:hypothetical protein